MAIFDFLKKAPKPLVLESGSLFGPYRLHELINEGGMAQLWLASNQQEETFALRIAHPTLNTLNRKRFIQGCEMLATLPPHPNVISYLEHGKIDSTPFLTMEYIEGANMRQLLANEDPILIDKIWDILFFEGHAP